MTGSLMNTYGDRALTLEKGEGVWIWDTEGNKYLDAVSGLAVCGLGHAHPNVTRAISNQASHLVHTSNLYNIPAQQQLADRLINLSGMENVFFGNSGAEANEAAIKIARKYGHSLGKDQPSVIVMENAFHGRTMATLSASGSRKVQAGFEPLLTGFARAPFNDIEAISQMAANNSNIVAVMVEPVQGEAGVNILDDHYLPELRKICDEHQWLLMLDEVQTGNGRTGKFFAYQHHHGFLPDVVTTAKGLANGFPIGACLARGAAAGILGTGNHGSTFGGNPLACAAALATIDTIENDGLMQNAESIGDFLCNKFKELLGDCKVVSDIRNHGLMLAIETREPCSSLVGMAASKGLLINVTGGNRIRLLPPLIINEDQAMQVAEILVPLIIDFGKSAETS
jgi:acetylornithine aminotransferase